MKRQKAAETLIARAGKEARPKLELCAADLVSVEKLTDKGAQRESTKVPTLNQQQPAKNVPKDYVGFKDLETMVDGKIMEGYQLMDTPHERVGPAVLTRFARGGKTRTLQEIGKMLQERQIPTLFITFNDLTAIDNDERQNITALQSVLMRIAWGAATEATVQKVIENAKKAGTSPTARNWTVSNFDFSEWIQAACIRKDEVEAWLQDQPLILLIDEFNQLLTKDLLDELKMADENTLARESDQAEEVAAFISKSFLKAELSFFGVFQPCRDGGRWA